MGQDIWAVGADLLPFSRADLGIKWHEIEHRPGSPQRQGSPRPGGENAEGAGWEGWPVPRSAASGCRWRENGRGLSQLLLPNPSPPSSLLTQAEGLPDPSIRLSLGWLPCVPGLQGVKVGGGDQTRARFSGLSDPCAYPSIPTAIFAQCPGMGPKGR